MGKTPILFATDIHGSEMCLRKFLNAADAYKVKALILGGDLTGKQLVPIVELQNGDYKVNQFGYDQVVSKEKVSELESTLMNSGIYYRRVSQLELEELHSNPERLSSLFTSLMFERLRAWLRLTEERLKAKGVKVYATGGNDDPMEVEKVLQESNYVIPAEGKVVELDDSHEMISTGYSNVTPWNCPRDIPDEELGEKIAALTQQVNNMTNCVFNFHVPPYNSGLDLAPELDKDLRPILGPGSSPRMVPVGSKAVRAAIEKYQPAVGLHGHIHESRGFVRIGRTLCLNPGSEYSEGVLRGALVVLTEKGVGQYLLTQG